MNDSPLIKLLRSLGCRKRGDEFILDEFDTWFYLRFDCACNNEDSESEGTCDVHAVRIPPRSADDDGVFLIKNAGPAEVVRFMLSLASSKFSGKTLRALQEFAG